MTQPFKLSTPADWLPGLLFGSGYSTALAQQGGEMSADACAKRLVRHNRVQAMRPALRIRLPAGALGPLSAFLSPQDSGRTIHQSVRVSKVYNGD